MQISQRLGLFGGRLSARLGSDDVLIITHEKLFNKNESRYLLDHIDPRYDTFRRFSIASAVTALGFAVLCAGLVWYGKTFHQPPDDGVYLFLAALCFVAAIVAGMKAIRSRVNLVVFNSPDGRRQFSLFGNRPSEREVKSFSDSLAKRIERIRYSGEISSERMAAILTKHADFLVEQGVLSDTERSAVIGRIEKKTRPNVVSIMGEKR